MRRLPGRGTPPAQGLGAAAGRPPQQDAHRSCRPCLASFLWLHLGHPVVKLSESHITLSLVSDDEHVKTTVERSCPSRCKIEGLSMEDLVDEYHTLSAQGQHIVESAAGADAVLIEWQLEKAPVINTLCYHVRRKAATPAIALCQGDEDELVAAIAAGADDTLRLPLYYPLLQAKILSYRRLVRAARASAPAEKASTEAQDHTVKAFGALRLDLTAHRFYVDEHEVKLTPREFALLGFLIDRPDTLCTRDEILNHVWGLSFNTGTNMVDVYMHFLRRKLEAHGLKDVIQTIRGRGYRLVLPEAKSQ